MIELISNQSIAHVTVAVVGAPFDQEVRSWEITSEEVVRLGTGLHILNI